MATSKTPDDYCSSVSRDAFKEIQAMISNDFQNRVVNQPNYDELLEDLQNETEEGYLERGRWRDEPSQPAAPRCDVNDRANPHLH